MKNRKERLLILYFMFASVYGILIFLYGFFPLKPVNESLATYDDLPEVSEYSSSKNNTHYKPSINRLVVMVIDALRADFVIDSKYSVNMPYLQDRLKSENVCVFKAKANPPTVTMPRLKAITAGTVPGFIDVALNLGSQELLEDNFIAQAKAKDLRVIFYGDDTWLKLFPHSFSRSEGTTSFFVADYEEVDNNVTRHLDTELKKNDWNIMILHYLGLDHIGHLEGPNSPLVPGKLFEMDEVIKNITMHLQALDQESTLPSLLLVCGDHGMKDSGSHGGASLAEVLIPFVAVGIPCAKSKTDEIVQQIDIVPTLSALLGLPIPKGNIGRILMEFFHHLPNSYQLYILHYNAVQVASLFENAILNFDKVNGYIQYKEAFSLYQKWLKYTSEEEEENGLMARIVALYNAALIEMSSTLAESFATFDLIAMTLAIGIIWQIIILLVSSKLAERKSNNAIGFFTFASVISMTLYCILMVMCSTIQPVSVACTNAPSCIISVVVTLGILATNAYLISLYWLGFCKLKKIPNLDLVKKLLLAGCTLGVISLLSSSFVEEEHQVWYFLWMSLNVAMLWRTVCSVVKNKINNSELKIDWKLVISLIGVLILNRFARKLNQTGDKWSHLPDIADWLIHANNKLFLSGMLFLSLCVLFLLIKPKSKLTAVASTIALACIYFYHSAAGTVVLPFAYPSSRGHLEAQIFRLILMCITIKDTIEGFHLVRMDNFSESCAHVFRTAVPCWIFFNALLQRPHNVILMVILLIQCSVLHSYSDRYMTDRIAWLSVAHVWMGMTFYFYQGNSNSLASIDLASGYVGLSHYNPIIVGIQLISNIYTFPVLSYLLLMRKIAEDARYGSVNKFSKDVKTVYHSVASLRLLPVAVYVVLITFQRYHLFVWTVFSPKLLYEGMHTLITCVVFLWTEFLLSCFR